MSNDDVKEGVIFGMGNPLLDISTNVDPDYLEKYGLKADNAILAEPAHMPMYQDLVSNYSVDYIAGGSTQNSMRVAQWMLQKPWSTSYIGCIGKDSFGEQLKEQATSSNVRVQYMLQDEQPTGTCAVLITGKSRSLVANLGAANCYDKRHLEKAENWNLLERADIAYIAGFFLTVSVDSIKAVGSHCSETNKMFCLNLSAPFICQFFKDQLLSVLPYVDFLFGNEDEAKAVAQAMELNTEDLKEIAQKLAAQPKVNTKRSRVVIITQGEHPVLMCKDSEVTESSVPEMKPEDILDTNGAGDAWVGGFLSQLALGRRLQDCLRGGHYAASVIIQRSGCTFPPKPDFATLA